MIYFLSNYVQKWKLMQDIWNLDNELGAPYGERIVLKSDQYSEATKVNLTIVLSLGVTNKNRWGPI